MKVKSFFQDILGTARVTQRRKQVVKNASSLPRDYDPVSDVAKALHPGKIAVSVSLIQEIENGAKVFTFSSSTKHFPYFKAGQYLTLEMKIHDSVLTRPFSIISAPYQTRGENPLVSIAVEKSDSIVSQYLLNQAKVGEVFQSEIGLGWFFYESLRDSKEVIALCEGTGVCSFCSMAKEIKDGNLDLNLTVFYLKKDADDAFLKTIAEQSVCDKVKVNYILKDEMEGIEKIMMKDASYFISGDKDMCLYYKKELLNRSVQDRRIRYSIVYPLKDVSLYESYPKENIGKTFKIKVLRGIKENVIEAKAEEPIAVSLERAGIKLHTGCRNGECGLCRIKIEQGDYFVVPFHDGRREADKEFHYVHACSTYPLSNLTVRVIIH